MSPVRVLVLAGGQSEEHPISLISARSVLDALNTTSLEAKAMVITREGRWLGLTESAVALTDANAPMGEAHTAKSAVGPIQNINDFDVVFPILHGPFGEDGTVQGMLELLGVPYVGSGVLGSSLCMDKAMSKDVLAHHGFSQVPYQLVTRQDLRGSRELLLDSLTELLQPPYFVKPANLGSSIGISRATDRAALSAALDVAARYDRRVLVEQGVNGARELEVGLLGNDDVEASPVGEIRYDAEFYDYETKYTDGRAALHIPAELPNSVAKAIQSEAERAFKALDCAGFARIDYFYDPTQDRIFLNEVNTIPGFTPFSMFTKLWESVGVSYGTLVERLVALSLERHTPRP